MSWYWRRKTRLWHWEGVLLVCENGKVLEVVLENREERVSNVLVKDLEGGENQEFLFS